MSLSTQAVNTSSNKCFKRPAVLCWKSTGDSWVSAPGGTSLELLFLWTSYLSAYIQLCTGLIREEGFQQQVEWKFPIRTAADVLAEGFNTCPQYLTVFLGAIHMPYVLLISIDFSRVHYLNPVLCSVFLPVFPYPFYSQLFFLNFLIFSVYFHPWISFHLKDYLNSL